jgi:hypothetical protein
VIFEIVRQHPSRCLIVVDGYDEVAHGAILAWMTTAVRARLLVGIVMTRRLPMGQFNRSKRLDRLAIDRQSPDVQSLLIRPKKINEGFQVDQWSVKTVRRLEQTSSRRLVQS